jgi:hypothetical protein
VTPEQPIIDVDTHLTDADPALWTPFIGTADAGLRPRIVAVDGVDRLDVGGLLLPKPAGQGTGSPLGIRAADHVDSLADRVAFIGKMGVRHAFLLPGFVGLAALDHPDRHARQVLAAAHNELVHHLSSQVAEIEFVPVVLPEEPEWSLAELRRWGTVRAVVSRPTTYQPRPYRDGTGSPLLAHLVDTGTVLMLHGATGYHQASPMADQFDDYRLTHVFSHPFEQMLALADLVHSGALDAGLRLAVVEAGCGWLPWFAGRLQEHYDHTGGLPRVDRDVVELLTRQILVSVEPVDDGIEAAVDRFGPGLLAFGSDFPHWDAARPEDLATMADRLGADTTRRVLHDNAEAFFFGAREAG